MHQLGLIVFLNENTKPGSTDPLQVAPSRPQTPPPPPFLPYCLGNEREIRKQLKLLELKKVNERIHQRRKKCLIIQTYGIRHYMK